MSESTAWGAPEARRLLSRSLRGSGIELGPGDSPFPLPPVAAVQLLDRWGTADNQRLFKEVPGDFLEPDLRVDLNTDKLSAVAGASQDFVIASHVLEHLVEPLGQLLDWYRVLAPGGTLLLLLPDRRRTFDRTRPPTSLQHLIEEFEAGVTHLDDAHLEEFVQHVPEDWGQDDPPRDQAERFERHRQRSIHVHVWAEDEFAEVIAYCIETLGMDWELLDRLSTDDVEGGIEFGLTLRKSTVTVPAALGTAHFRATWTQLGLRTHWASEALAAERQARQVAEADRDRQLATLRAELEKATAELEQAKRVLSNHERVLGPLRRAGAGALLRRLR